MTVTASAPATTANLGPGYDCIALALQPRCAVSAEPSDTWSVEHVGAHRLGPDDPDSVLAAAHHVSQQPLRLIVDNGIPLAKGLGSSAAALVAGVAACLGAIGEDVVPDRVFRVAADIEGHPEQVAAAVYGGLVLIPAEGMPIRLPLHPTIRPLVAIPEGNVETGMARGVVEPEQPLDVVVRSLARMAALTAGLLTGDRDLLGAAHGDEIHEAPRACFGPEVEALMSVARSAGALHAARSGSGPAVLALVDAADAAQVAQALTRAGASVLDGPMDTNGLLVSRSGQQPV